MSLAEALAQRTSKRPSRCKFGAIYDRLDTDDQNDLEAAFAAGVDYVDIAAALCDVGHPVSDSTVSRHARGLCGCDG